MNIALFSDTYLPDINGVATSTHILRNALVKHGHQVVVVTTELPDGSNYVDHENIIRIPGIEIKQMYGYRASSFFSIKGMQELKEMNLDLIHMQTEFGIGIFGKIVSEYLNIPIVYTYHTMYEDYTHYFNPINSGFVENLLSGLAGKISKLYGGSCTELIAPSQKTKEVLESYGITKNIHVIGTGLELERFDRANIDIEKVNLIKDKYDLNDKFTIIFLGRIAKEKSVDFIIRSLKELIKIRNDVRLLIVGGGPSLNDYKELTSQLNLNDYIIFTGPQPAQDVPSFYHASNCFVSASLTETQGLTYIEAMASGIPAIARYDKNLEGVIIDGYNGYFVEDENQLKNKLLDMMDTDLTTISNQAYLSTKPFSSEEFYYKIIYVYEQAIMHYQFCYHVTSIRNGLNDTSIISFKSLEDTVIVELPNRKVEEYNLTKGAILQPKELNDIRDYEGIVQAYHKALRFLTIRDYTEQEMINKLTKLDTFSSSQINKTIDLLKEKALINDFEYTSTYLEKASKNGEGIYKAIQKLKKRGIADETIEKCQNLYSDDLAYEAAYSICEKMYLTNTTRSNQAIIQKIRNKLYHQGFSQNIIERVFENFVFNENDELNKELLSKEFEKAKTKYQNEDKRKTRQKIYAYLVRKGFKQDEVFEILNERWNEYDD